MGINPGNPAFGLPPAEGDLPRQVKDIERTTRENLASVVSSFKTTVERLDAAIATQSQMITDLQEVVNAQVVPWVSSGAASGFLATTTFTTFVNAPIAVPEGYTRALVLASGQVSAGNSSAMDIAQIFAHIVIDGIVGADSSVSVAGIIAATVPAFASASLAGLSGGWITIGLGARTSNGSSDPALTGFDKATLTAQAIFLR